MKDGKIRWRCRCDCGEYRDVAASPLNQGRQQSCGCWRQDFAREIRRSTRTGATERVLYGTWSNIKERTECVTSKDYPNWGGRGIRLHPAWRADFFEFERWILENIGERAKGMSLDRIDNDGNYEPGNVRWATKAQQARNRRPGVRNRDLDAMTAERDVWRQRAIDLGWRID